MSVNRSYGGHPRRHACRRWALLAPWLLLSACASPSGPSGDTPAFDEGNGVAGAVPPGAAELAPTEVDTLVALTYSGIADPWRRVVATVSAWESAWAEIHSLSAPTPPTPAVDFTTTRVLVLASGTHPTGGYAIGLGTVATEGDTLFAVVREESPDPTCLVTMALTRPVLVVALPAGFSSVRFVEEETVRSCA